MTDVLLRVLAGLLPVLLFLAGLILLDSYKLLRPRAVLLAICAGAAAAGSSYLLNVELLQRVDLPRAAYSQYVAPVIEETAKGLLLVYLIRSHRVGFLVDAAIFAFAVGAGFALIENVYYLNLLVDSHLVVWFIRGCGTAIMHGGTTAVFAIMSKALIDRGGPAWPLRFLPGWGVAVLVHSVFNRFPLSPVLSTLGILLLLPLLVAAVFRRSEKALQRWLDVGFDADTELLELIHSGALSGSRVGRYLQQLKVRFRGEVVADLLCYLRLHVELSLRAKGELMMREHGFHSEITPEIRAKFVELEYLAGSIGKTGRLALSPFLHFSGKDLWQLYMLERS